MGIAAKALKKPILLKDGTDNKTIFYSLANGTCGIASYANKHKKINQDSVVVIPKDKNECVFVIADGAGGHPQADVAAQATTNLIRRRVLSAIGKNEDIRVAIIEGIQNANKKIINLKTGAASTVVVAHINKASVQTYHSGDSSVLIFGSRGALKYRTVGHSALEMGLEAGLEKLMDLDDPQYFSIVTNFLGYREMRISVGYPVPLSKKDTIIVCSDGLTDNLHDKEIGECIKKQYIPVVTEQLISEVMKNMYDPIENRLLSKPDDLSVICFKRD